MSVSLPRLTWFDWMESKVVLKRDVTPSDGVGGAPAKEMTPIDHVRYALGFDGAIESKDVRPTLVYFHWPHEDVANGKVVECLCGKVLDDEATARWGMLFRCVQVDMTASDTRLVALLGAGSKPSFAVVDGAAEVVARIPAVGSAVKMQKALEAALEKFPEQAKKAKDALAEQDKTLAQARAAAKADRLEESKGLYDSLRAATVRVGPQYDRALIEGSEVEARIARAKK